MHAKNAASQSPGRRSPSTASQLPSSVNDLALLPEIAALMTAIDRVLEAASGGTIA